MLHPNPKFAKQRAIPGRPRHYCRWRAATSILAARGYTPISHHRLRLHPRGNLFDQSAGNLAHSRDQRLRRCHCHLLATLGHNFPGSFHQYGNHYCLGHMRRYQHVHIRGNGETAGTGSGFHPLLLHKQRGAELDQWDSAMRHKFRRAFYRCAGGCAPIHRLPAAKLPGHEVLSPAMQLPVSA